MKALVYIANQLSGITTFEDMRVMGGEYIPGGANGFISGNLSPDGVVQNRGTIKINRVELAYNGGENGPAHNAYFGKGDYTIEMTNSWTHDGVYGHLFKTRAPRNTITGNYFQGGMPQTENGFTMAESYNLDIPCGGVAKVVGNVFAKGESGANTNGVMISYNAEKSTCKPAYDTHIIDYRNNTFVAFAKTYDGQHAIFPFAFFANSANGRQIPGDPYFPASSWTIKNNTFIGFCPAPGPDGHIPSLP